MAKTCSVIDRRVMETAVARRVQRNVRGPKDRDWPGARQGA